MQNAEHLKDQRDLSVKLNIRKYIKTGNLISFNSDLKIYS